MTAGEAKVLETDVVIFQMESNRNDQETSLAEEPNAELSAEKQSMKVDLVVRFARLKKSLRKRSASIL